MSFCGASRFTSFMGRARFKATRSGLSRCVRTSWTLSATAWGVRVLAAVSLAMRSTILWLRESGPTSAARPRCSPIAGRSIAMATGCMITTSIGSRRSSWCSASLIASRANFAEV